MFQDEARFGRINDPKRCWSPKRTRPTVGKQIIREYTYAYGAVSPRDGAADFLIVNGGAKLVHPGGSKTSPLNVMRYAVLGGCPDSP